MSLAPHFDSSFSVGVEEELLVVDAETNALAPVAEKVLEGAALPEALAAHEAYAAEIELRSPHSAGVADALAALRRGRAAACAAAAEAGAALMGAGLHPAGAMGDAALVAAERYRRVEDSMRGLIRRTPECALHLHVGLPDAEAAVRAFNGLREHLPVLQGLAASSPWWFGEDSGLASARFFLVRAYPGRGVPPAFADYDDYAGAVERVIDAGELEDYTFLWWDLRLHPRLGTVELRELDSQSSLEDVAALAALAQALAAHATDEPTAEPTPAEALSWSSFRAARDGVAASLLHMGRVVPLREAARGLLELARPHARELGSDGALDGIERILATGGGAARQRAAHAEGGIARLLEYLVGETCGSQ